MTASLNTVRKLAATMDARYQAWEAGDASPSVVDFVFDVEDLGYTLALEDRTLLADRMAAALDTGVTTSYVALLAVEFAEAHAQ